MHQELDTFCYAERELLASWPKLAEAPVYIHFQSHMQVGTSCASPADSCPLLVNWVNRAACTAQHTVGELGVSRHLHGTLV